MKIAVLGSTGMLGSMLADYLGKRFHIETPRFDAANIRWDDLLANLWGCGWIINAIGVIPQRWTSDEQAWRVNADFPLRLAGVAEFMKATVIQIATDCVYDGKRGGYSECDAANPQNIAEGKRRVYSMTKLEGETYSPCMRHLRCSIVGPETHGKSLMGWFLNQPSNQMVTGFVNHQWNGVTTLHFAKVCEGIIRREVRLPYIHHLIPADSVSKCELLGLFAREFGRGDITIQPTKTPESVDLTLVTANAALNQLLWNFAGYPEPPTIAEMVRELADCFAFRH